MERYRKSRTGIVACNCEVSSGVYKSKDSSGTNVKLSANLIIVEESQR